MDKVNDSNLNEFSIQLDNGIDIEGPILVEPLDFIDDRGSFKKLLPNVANVFTPHFPVMQVNTSANAAKGTIRGLHYQAEPFSEFKLVSCIKGSVVDVLLDMRPGSATYGKFSPYFLSPDTGSLLIPPLVAHGFQTLEDETFILYLHSNNYSPSHELGINPLDPEIGINWPLPISAISQKDKLLPHLKEIEIGITNL